MAPVYLLRDDADAGDDVAIMTPRFARASSSFVNPVASLPNTTATLVPFAA